MKHLSRRRAATLPLLALAACTENNTQIMVRATMTWCFKSWRMSKSPKDESGVANSCPARKPITKTPIAHGLCIKTPPVPW